MADGATAEGTRAAAHRFGAPPRPLGRTGLVVAPLGFSAHRLREGDVLHARALRMALAGGIQVIETRGPGDAAVVDRVLREAITAGDVTREQIVVVTELDGGATPQDLHPEGPARPWATNRQGPGRVDLALLRLPRWSSSDLADPERVAALRAAFARLEAEVEAGHLGHWGIACPSFATSDPASSTSLPAVLDVVIEAAGDDHRCAAIQVPLNALELGAVTHPAHDGRTAVECAADRGLGVLVERPLVARASGATTWLPLVDRDAEAPELGAALAAVRKLEAGWRGGLGGRIRTEAGDAGDLFRWGQVLSQPSSRPATTEAWLRLRHEVIAPHVGQASAALLGHLGGAERDMFARWWQTYGTALHQVFTALEAELAAAPWDRALGEAIASVLPPPWRDQPRSRQAVGVALAAPVSVVLVGMRSPRWVADILATGELPPVGPADFAALARRVAPVAAQLAR